MGKVYEHIDPSIQAFIEDQHMFFVATAPLSEDGHVNVSPKGLESFAILSPNKVAYLDLGGSGIETHAHVVENERITIMFVALSGKANIIRLYGKGTVYDFNHSEYSEKLNLFPAYKHARAVIEIDVTRVSDSCGWGVPLYHYKGQREQLTRWSSNYSEQEWKTKRYARNAKSIDGLPGLIDPKT